MRPEISLGDKTYDSASTYIDQSYRFGVVDAFKRNKNFNLLSSKLKTKLVFEVLKQYNDKLFYFFNDINS